MASIMKANVYIKDDKIHIMFDNENYDKVNKTVYQLGSSILDFAQTDIDATRKIYDKFVEHAFMLTEINNEYFPEDIGKPGVVEIRMDNNYSPYEYFHLKSFMDGVHLAIVNQETDLTQFIEKLPEVEECYIDEGDPVRKYVFTFKEIIFATFTRRINTLKKEIDFIVNILSVADEKAAKLTPMQRLYLLDLERKNVDSENEPYYTNNPFTTRYVPLLNGVPVPENISPDDITSKNLEVVEMYEINGIDDLIRFELLKMVSSGVIVKKCANCGQYFVPVGRVDTVYCNRVYKGSENNRTCAEIGSMLKYKDKIKADPIYTAYNKAYKRNNSRVRNKLMTHSNFMDWSEEARRLRDDCYSGKISLDEYKQWLDKDKL